MKLIKITESDLKKIVQKVLLREDAEPLPDMENVPLGKVEAVQQALLDAGYDIGPTGVDGVYGRNTRNAVLKYQRDNGIKQTGNVGPLTAGKLGVQPLVTGTGTTQSKTAPKATPKATQSKTKSGVKSDFKLPQFDFKNQVAIDNTYVSQKPLPVPKKGDTTKKVAQPTKAKTTAPKAVATSAAKTVAKKATGTDSVLNPNASLLFDGDQLSWLSNGKVVKSWSAVSGLTWKNTPGSEWGKMLNRYTKSPQEWSKDKDAGPLPEGGYVVGPLETRSGNQEEIGALEAFWDKITGQVSNNDADRAFGANTLLSRISWGNYRAFIKPTGGQKMYDRGSFYVHGGSIRGSHGCIDLTNDMADFAKFFGIWTAATKKKTIPLTVKYNTPLLNQVIKKLTSLF